jgi:hypothetical protein
MRNAILVKVTALRVALARSGINRTQGFAEHHSHRAFAKLFGQLAGDLRI